MTRAASLNLACGCLHLKVNPANGDEEELEDLPCATTAPCDEKFK